MNSPANYRAVRNSPINTFFLNRNIRIPGISVAAVLLFGITLIYCNNSSSDEACSGPTLHGCTGSQCVYSYIYDEQNHFINEVSSSGMSFVPWNGTDCRGNKVPCGKYRFEHHVVVSGNELKSFEDFLFTDSTGTTKGGRSACDSLKKECSGHYAETIGAYFGDDGTPHSNEPVCVCCE